MLLNDSCSLLLGVAKWGILTILILVGVMQSPLRSVNFPGKGGNYGVNLYIGSSMDSHIITYLGSEENVSRHNCSHWKKQQVTNPCRGPAVICRYDEDPGFVQEKMKWGTCWVDVTHCFVVVLSHFFKCSELHASHRTGSFDNIAPM